MPQAFAAALLHHRKGASDAQKDINYLFNCFHLVSNNPTLSFHRQRSTCESPTGSEGEHGSFDVGLPTTKDHQARRRVGILLEPAANA